MNKISDSGQVDEFIKNAHDQAKVIQANFNILRAQGDALMIVEGEYASNETSMKNSLSTQYCACLAQTGDKVECGTPLENMRENTRRNSLTNIVEVLAKMTLGTDRVIFPDKRSVLINLIYAVNQLPTEYSDENYHECFSFAAKHGPTAREFFSQAYAIIDQFIEDTQECIALFADEYNKSAAENILEDLKDYKEQWIVLQNTLNFPPSKSFTAKLVKFIKDAQDQGNYQNLISLSRQIQQLNQDKQLLAHAFDYSILKHILGKQSPAHILAATGFLHTGTLSSILTREGYHVTYDSKIQCRSPFGDRYDLESNEENIVDCGKNIQSRPTSEVIKLFEQTMPKTHIHEEL
jgi:hypothetical protein